MAELIVSENVLVIAVVNRYSTLLRFFCKKALLGAFFFVCTSPFLWAADRLCPIIGHGESFKVKYINDGDTLTLSTGVRVRILGIDAPEIDYKNLQNSEPGAIAARNFVLELVKPGDFVHLFFDKKTQDRYGRILAQIRLKDKSNLAAKLLNNGHAQQLLYPPNVKFWKCYQGIEQEAQKLSLGIWKHQEYWPQPAASATKSNTGYQRFTGVVVEQEETNRYYWLSLEHKIWLGIKKKDQNYFPDFYFSEILGKKIDVRGWLYYSHDALRMRIRHPQQLVEISEETEETISGSLFDVVLEK